MNNTHNSNADKRYGMMMKTAVYGAAVLVICAGIHLAFRYALPILFPFAAAFLLAGALRPAAEVLKKRIRLPVSLTTVVFILLILGAAAGGIFLIGAKLWREAADFVSVLLGTLDSPNNLLHRITAFLDSLTVRFPFSVMEETGRETGEAIYGFLSDMLRSALEKISEGLAAVAANAVRSVPGIAFSAAVSIIAAYYLCADYGNIAAFLKNILPDRVRETAVKSKNVFVDAAKKYARAYLLIFLLTFAELFLGLSLLKMDYAMLIALLIAFVDLLPVLGAGTVLFPWGLFHILCGEYFIGISLMILAAAMYVIRQFAEPRIVGACIGAPPFITLLAIFAGYKLAGLLGMLTAPFFVFVLSRFLEKRVGEDEKCEKNAHMD